MTRRELLAVVVTLCVSWAGVVTVSADVTVTRRVTLRSSPQATWALVGDYCGIAQWDPGVARCEIASGTNNRAGAVRRLTLADGASMTEELLTYDTALRTYSYRIVTSPLPVASYTAMLSVFAAPNGGSIVEWTATFTANPGADEAALRRTVEQMFDDGLASVREKGAGR